MKLKQSSLLDGADDDGATPGQRSVRNSGEPGRPTGSKGNSDAERGPAIRVLRLKEVIEITGLGKTTIYQLQSAGEFPRRVKMTAQAVGWIEDEVRSWIEARLAARTES